MWRVNKGVRRIKDKGEGGRKSKEKWKKMGGKEKRKENERNKTRGRMVNRSGKKKVPIP